MGTIRKVPQAINCKRTRSQPFLLNKKGTLFCMLLQINLKSRYPAQAILVFQGFKISNKIELFQAVCQTPGCVVLWNDVEEVAKDVSDSLCLRWGMLVRVKPWCCACHRDSNWVGCTPYTQKNTKDKRHDVREHTHTEACSHRKHTLRHKHFVNEYE